MTTAGPAKIDLAQHIEVVARRLLGEPNPRLSTRTKLRFGTKGALCVKIAGPRQGTWYDYSDDIGGGVLDLIVRGRGGGRADAFEWLREELRIEVDEAPIRSQLKPGEIEALRHATLSDRGWRLWRACGAISVGCPASRYLSARGCALPHPDGDLRWHPHLRHPSGHVGPALIGLVTDVWDASRRLSLHRTWVEADGHKAFDDLPADMQPKARLFLKDHQTAGGVVRLWPDDSVEQRLTIGEGIETTLAAARTHWPAWACLSAGQLKTFPVLPGIEALAIVVDHDKAGIAAALAAGGRWRAAGLEVGVLYPAKAGADWADVAAAGEATAS